MPFILCLDSRDNVFSLSTSRDCFIEDFAMHAFLEYSIKSTWAVNMEILSSSSRGFLPLQWDLMRTWTPFNKDIQWKYDYTHTQKHPGSKQVFLVQAMDPYYIVAWWFYVCSMYIHIYIYGLWFGAFFFFHILGIIIPTDEVIFFRGVGWNHQAVPQKLAGTLW